MIDKDELPEEDLQTDTARQLNNLREKVDPLVDMVIGHRQRFLDADFSEEGAEDAALFLHGVLVEKVVGGRTDSRDD